MTEPEVSPVPWPLVLVMGTSVFSALLWGFSTLFNGRRTFRGPREADGEDGQE
ncbi:MAG: hypothetical protein H6735_01550 [Alphaproteobacteria bacterium]|nr:hypothetical protein [Alphaproteobacteria bacterium]